MRDDDEVRTIGWDAIDAALARIYEDREPIHYGPLVPESLGGDEPLQGISIYKNLEPLPHFHFVTYGFTDLDEKEGDDFEWSGFGFELTFRLACNRTDVDPPVWTINFLQNLARYVFSTGNRLGEYHHLNLNGPIALDEETAIGYIALSPDPQLGELETANGRVVFLQIVGLCADEYELAKDWDCEQLLQHVQSQWPLLITDLRRQSTLADPIIAAGLRSQAEREGSSQGETFASHVEWKVKNDVLQMTLGATATVDVVKLLRSRVLHNKPFTLYGNEKGIVFQPAAESRWELDETLAVLSLSVATVGQMLESLKPERGVFQWSSLPSARIKVVPSEIKDQDGNVMEVIG